MFLVLIAIRIVICIILINGNRVLTAPQDKLRQHPRQDPIRKYHRRTQGHNRPYVPLKLSSIKQIHELTNIH